MIDFPVSMDVFCLSSDQNLYVTFHYTYRLVNGDPYSLPILIPIKLGNVLPNITQLTRVLVTAQMEKNTSLNNMMLIKSRCSGITDYQPYPMNR